MDKTGMDSLFAAYEISIEEGLYVNRKLKKHSLEANIIRKTEDLDKILARQ